MGQTQWELNTYIARGCGAEPIIRKNTTGTKVGRAKEGAFEREVPVRHGHGRIHRLQCLLVHERQSHVRRHEARALVPMIAIFRTAWKIAPGATIKPQSVGGRRAGQTCGQS